MEQAVRTARGGTARPVTSASGRFVRLGTASMLSAEDNGLFINVAKLDLRKYATRPPLAKALFLYMLHVTNDTLRATELAAFATEHENFKDWWWKGGSARGRGGRVMKRALSPRDVLRCPPPSFAFMPLR